MSKSVIVKEYIDRNNLKISIMNILNKDNLDSTIKEQKEYTLLYLKNTNNYHSRIEKIDDYHFRGIGTVCRLILSKIITLQEIDGLLSFTKKIENLKNIIPSKKNVEIKSDTQLTKNQFHEFSKADYILGELMGLEDDFLKTFELKVNMKSWLVNQSSNKSTNEKITTYYNNILSELNEIPNNDQLIEAYSCYDKSQLKKYKEFILNIISACGSFSKVTVSKNTKPINLVKRLKYKLSDEISKMSSINPTKIIGSKQLWVFDTEHKRITVYNCLDNQKLSINGTTVANFDTEKSFSKKIRNPEELYNLELTRSNLINIFKLFKTKEQSPSPRINSNCILVAAY